VRGRLFKRTLSLMIGIYLCNVPLDMTSARANTPARQRILEPALSLVISGDCLY
jgi:hypothetical protein